MSSLPASEESPDAMQGRHRKELKALDGEKRAALKKAKSTKGKKAKEAVKTLEAEYDEKLKKLKERHATEMSGLDNGSGSGGSADRGTGNDTDAANGGPVAPATADNDTSREQQPSENDADRARQRKQDKARRKREKAREKERQREADIAAETAAAGPSPRDTEMERIREVLSPLGLAVVEVPADGNCLYRAVGAQCAAASGGDVHSFAAIRSLCADTLAEHEADFAPFCEFTEAAPDYASYCQRVRASSDWGGHLELRALSIALQRPIHVYSAAAGAGQEQPLVIQEEQQRSSDADPVRLSYHLHYYALGEHYNQVVACQGKP